MLSIEGNETELPDTEANPASSPRRSLQFEDASDRTPFGQEDSTKEISFGG